MFSLNRSLMLDQDFAEVDVEMHPVAANESTSKSARVFPVRMADEPTAKPGR